MTNKPLKEASVNSNRPTIALCMIAKDKADIIERALDSTLHKGQPVFDYYCLVDTGSSDKTVEVFKTWVYKNGAFGDVQEKEVGKDYRYVEVNGEKILADFAKARNDSFNIARKFKADWAFWMDTDDILVGGEHIQELAKIATKKGHNQIGMIYNYHKVGNVKTVTQRRERMLSLNVPGKWVERVHENYVMDKPEDSSIMFVDHIYLDHLRTAFEAKATSRRNNLIMKEDLEEKGLDGISDKMLRDLAYDHWEHQEWNEAIELYERYLQRIEKLPNLNPEAIYTVYTKLSRAYMNSAQMEQAIAQAMKSMTIMPERPEAYLILAEAYGNMTLWDDAVHFADKVLEIGIPRTISPINEAEFNIIPLRIKMQAMRARGKYKEAQKIATKLLSIVPDNAQFKAEYDSLSDNILTKSAVTAIAQLTKFYIENNKGKEVDKILTAIPLEIKDQSMIRELIKEIKHEHKRKTKSYKLSGKKKISIYAGPHYEAWNGHSDKEKGIGGSEGMTIQMARELALLGNDVTVYNECRADDGEIFDGVKYVDHNKWQTTEDADVFISLRNPTVFKRLPLITAKKQYLWLHDTTYGMQEKSNFYAPNKVIVLSEYHKEIIKQNHGIKDDDQFYITRNALNKNALEYADKSKVKRQPYKLIYASSYDRGLDHALRMFPAIKKSVPEAELHVFYGWNTFDAMMKMRRNTPTAEYMARMKEEIEELLQQDGVVHHGRVSQNELYKEFASSDVWFYPTEFTEISCITAMQAQALGAVPVTTPVAALRETVSSKYGVKTTLDQIQETVIYYLQNRTELEKKRKPMIEWARKEYDINSLAKEWDKLFNED